MKKLIQITSSAGLLIGASIFITSLVNSTASTSQAQSKELPKAYAQTMKLGDPMPGNLFIELAKLINPTVVNISTSTIPRGGRGGGPRDPFFDMLEKFYGITSEKATEFFRLHADLDRVHAQVWWDSIVKSVETEEDKVVAVRAVTESRDAMYGFLDGICRAYMPDCQLA